MLYVLDPIDLQLHACPVETQLGSKLYLSLQMNAIVDGHITPITECSRLYFEVSIQDESIFRFVSVQSPSLSASQKSAACALLVLDAVNVGRTNIKVTTLITGRAEGLNEDTKQTTIQLSSNELQIGSYSALKSIKSQLVLSQGSSILVNLYDGPLLSSLNLTPSSSMDPFQPTMYLSETSVSDEKLVLIGPANWNYEPNKYSYLIKCLPHVEQTDSLVTATFKLAHKNSQVNRCPVVFEYEIKVRCAQPHSLQLSQLLVNNEEALLNPLGSLKWKCGIKSSAKHITAHYERDFFVQVNVRDSMDNLFDNFTAAQLEWMVGNKKVLEKSSKNDLSSVELSVDEVEGGVQLSLADSFNSNKVYYQTFHTKAKTGETKLSVKLKAGQQQLAAEMNVQLVEDVRIRPDTLTVFNHPSNVVALNLSNGSGHFHAEIETIRSQADNEPEQVCFFFIFLNKKNFLIYLIN